MTEQEMNKIIAEVAKVVKTEMKNEIEVKNGRNVTKPLEQAKAKWFRSRKHNSKKGAMSNAFDVYDVSKVWDHVRRLTCYICGVKYVQELEGCMEAEEICDELCQKIYELRKKVVTKEQLGIEVEGYKSGEIVAAEREENDEI